MPSLARFGVFDKPNEPPPFVDRRLAGQLLAERRKMPNFLSSRRTSPMVCSERMKNRTPHAVDVMGGRSSAIIRRMSANRFREWRPEVRILSGQPGSGAVAEK